MSDTTTQPAAALDGRRILVTGAGSGIGRATVQRMAAAGARVALLDRETAAMEAVGKPLGMPCFVCDVSDQEAIAAAVAGAEAALGGLDGVVNAAGISMRGTIEELSLADLQTVLAVNLIGPFLVVKEIVPALRRSGKATIVNIASIGALRPARGVAAYCAAKAGLLMFGKCMAFEFGPDIRVNTICPGTTETAMTESLLADEATRTRLTTGNALGRLGQPDEIAEAILFLTSHASSYVNGATLVVDGGYVWL